MISADQLSKRFLIWGVAAAAVCPRMPFDRRWSIGGNFSSGFRKLLLTIVVLNFCRLAVSGNQEFSSASGLFSDFLGVLEVTGLTFLSFLTPYVLETQLSRFIHIRPGQNFYLPLVAAALLSFLGVTLSRTVHPNLWCLKKLANAASGPPVITVLRTFNAVTTAQAHGNGFTIGQTVLTIEYWHLGLQLLCALGYAFQQDDKNAAVASGWDAIWAAARSTAFLGDWTRVLAHAIFLNGIDEMNHLGVFGETTRNDGGRAGIEMTSSMIVSRAP